MKKSNNEKKLEKIEKYHIWDVIPSFNDIDSVRAVGKVGLIIGLGIIYCIGLLFLTLNIPMALGVGIFVIASFLIIFHGAQFSTAYLGDMKLKTQVHMDIFKDLTFWQLKKDPSALFFTNKTDALTTGIRIFQVTILPQNIHPTFWNFLKSLSHSKVKVPFTQQAFQVPLTPNDTTKETYHASARSYRTVIYFSTHACISGVLSQHKVERLLNLLNFNTNALHIAFQSNEYHYQIKLLMGNDLLNALRTSFTQSPEVVNEPTEFKVIKELGVSFIFKLFIVLFNSILIGILLSQLFAAPLYIILLAELILGSSIVLLWWRELLSLLSTLFLTRAEEAQFVDPFYDMKFFRLKAIPDTLFLRVQQCLMGIKQIQASGAFYPVSIAKDKPARYQVGKDYSFSYTFAVEPLTSHEFNRKDYLEKCTEKALKQWDLYFNNQKKWDK